MKASVIGGTGLVGGEILAELLADPEFSEVEIFTRRATGVSHQKLTETFVDFDDPASWASKISGEVLFSAFGTTISAAGSREAQYLVDFHYQLDVARWARSQGVSRYVLISSSGADPRSLFFYLRMKGELESAVKELGFAVTVILRPGPLRGKRKIVRFGESVSTAVLGFLPPVKALARFLPVPGSQVARRAVEAAKTVESFRILEASDIYF